jgi:hypothetical protein
MKVRTESESAFNFFIPLESTLSGELMLFFLLLGLLTAPLADDEEVLAVRRMEA